MNKFSKKIYFEIMRIIACYFVIFDHSLIMNKSNHLSNCGEWAQLFLHVFCKFPVPLFFMISGALLLSKKETVRIVWSKRISKTVITLTFFSILYYIYNILANGEPFSVADFIIKIYSDYKSINVTFWFLYAYIAFLILLPILRIIAQSLSNNQFYYLFSIVIVLNTIIPLFEYFYSRGIYGYNGNLLVGYGYIGWLGKECIIYPLLGYFIDNRVNIEKSKKIIVIIWMINIITILLSCFFTYIKINYFGIVDDNFQIFRSTFVYINATTLFLSIKYICSILIEIPHIFEGVICAVSQCTFGIYLMHMLVIFILDDIVRHDTIINIFIFSFLIFATCYGVVFILRRIPMVKKIL